MGRDGLGKHTGHVFKEPAACDMGETLDRGGRGVLGGGKREGFEDRLDVDAGWSEEGATEGEGCLRGRG